jgi:hypothetical protein
MPSSGLIVFLALLAIVAAAMVRTVQAGRARRALQRQHPNEPWLWRKDWAEGVVRGGGVVPLWFVWIFGCLWMLIAIPVLLQAKVSEHGPGRYLIYFPGVAVIVLCFAVFMTAKRIKYGVSLCRLERVPAPVGGTLRGEIQAGVRETPQNGFQLRLSCVRRVVTGSGKSRSEREIVEWQDAQTVGTGHVMPGSEGARVPFRFDIPADCEPCDESDPRNVVLWRLDVRADMPGIDYTSRFELPVFRTAESFARVEPLHAEPEGPWTPSEAIQFAMSPAGEEIIVRSARKTSDWIGYSIFFFLWFGALGTARLFFDAPLWIVLTFAGIGALVVISAVDFLMRTTHIITNREGVTIRRHWLGLGGTRTIPASDIEAIAHGTGMQNNDVVYYDVRAVLRSGSSVVLAKTLRDKRDAQGIARRIQRQLGR